MSETEDPKKEGNSDEMKQRRAVKIRGDKSTRSRGESHIGVFYYGHGLNYIMVTGMRRIVRQWVEHEETQRQESGCWC